MKEFIECSDENETVIGKGGYSKSGINLLIFTEDHSVSKLFVKRIRSQGFIKELTFIREQGKEIFEGPLFITECREELGEGWYIELKEREITIKS